MKGFQNIVTSLPFLKSGEGTNGFKRSIALTSTAKNHYQRWMSSSSSQPVIELREDSLFPEHTATYMEKVVLSSKNSSVVIPKQLCFLSQPQMGGNINVATHAYYFQGGLSERRQLHQSLEQDLDWTEWNKSLKPCIQSEQSTLFVEAPLVKHANLEGMGAAAIVNQSNRSCDQAESQNDCILELRRYYLKLGYDTVPKFLDLYGKGLPSKLHAPGTDPTTSLVTLLYSEVGRLNEVIEIWRHGNGVPAMEQSRTAARKAQEWRSAIASIAELAIEFRSTIHQPIISKW
jgi:hypothetical protein